MKLLKIIVIAAMVISALLIFPAAADNEFIELTGVSAFENVEMTSHWSPTTDEHFSKAYENGTFDLWNFMTGSIMSPFSKIMGDWLPLIVFFLFFCSIFLKNGISYLTICLGLLGSIWYAFLPVSSIPLIMLVFALGIAAILYRLYKNRR